MKQHKFVEIRCLEQLEEKRHLLVDGVFANPSISTRYIYILFSNNCKKKHLSLLKVSLIIQVYPSHSTYPVWDVHEGDGPHPPVYITEKWDGTTMQAMEINRL